MVIKPRILKMAKPHMEDALEFVKGYQYMKVKRLSKGIGVSKYIAGVIFHAMEWKQVSGNKSKPNKTYENPEWKFSPK